MKVFDFSNIKEFNLHGYLIHFIQLVSLLLITFFVCYYTSNLFSVIVFIIFFVLFFKSEFDYFWIVFFYILLSEVGGFFPSGSKSFFGHLPVFTLIPGISFGLIDLVIIISFLKSIFKKRKLEIPFKIILKPLFLYLIFLLFLSIIWGLNMKDLKYSVQALISLSFIISFPTLINKKVHFFYFMTLLIPFIFLDFSSQIFELFNGYKLSEIFTGKVKNEEFTLLLSDDLSGGERTKIACYLNLIIFMYSFFILDYYKLSMNKIWEVVLIIVVFICYTSVFLTATRGWTISYSIMLILALFNIFFRRQVSSIFFTFSFGLIIVYYIFLQISVIQIQSINSIARLTTTEELFKGDQSAGGTLTRLTERSPRVMAKFYENPLTGWGFSIYGINDSHVGNQNLLAQTGIIGFSLFMFFIIYILLFIYNIKYKVKMLFSKMLSLNIFAIIIIGIIVIHTSSTQFIGYDMGFASSDKILVWSILLGSIWHFSKFILEEENEIINK